MFLRSPYLLGHHGFLPISVNSVHRLYQLFKMLVSIYHCRTRTFRPITNYKKDYILKFFHDNKDNHLSNCVTWYKHGITIFSLCWMDENSNQILMITQKGRRLIFVVHNQHDQLDDPFPDSPRGKAVEILKDGAYYHDREKGSWFRFREMCHGVQLCH